MPARYFFLDYFVLSSFQQQQMKSEQLFEIERQISQIRKSLQQRQERVVEWTMPVARILKERKDKDGYLSKKYSYLQKDKQNAKGKDLQAYVRDLTTHVAKSRNKIRVYQNDLKQLHELVKRKNGVGLRKNCSGRSRPNFNQGDVTKNGGLSKAHSKTDYEMMGSNDMGRKTQKGHNVLSTIKAEKILELYQQSKTRFGAGEQSICNLKRQLGMGLENTPFYSWVCNRGRADDGLGDAFQCSQTMNKQTVHYDLFKEMKKQMGGKKQVYLNLRNERGAKFQGRLKNIMRYHQENVEALL